MSSTLFTLVMAREATHGAATRICMVMASTAADIVSASCQAMPEHISIAAMFDVVLPPSCLTLIDRDGYLDQARAGTETDYDGPFSIDEFTRALPGLFGSTWERQVSSKSVSRLN